MRRRLSTLLLLALAVGLSARGASADPLRLTLFSAVDREAIEVGGLVQMNVEALASPETTEAGDALAAAFAAWDVTGQVGPGFEVVRFTAMQRRDTDGVVELQRRLVLRVRQRVGEVPTLRLAVTVGGRAWTFETRAHAVETFGGAERATEAGGSVVAITAEGDVEGAGFQRIGSAFLVGDDALVTAFHVVVGARRVRVALPDGDVWIDRAWALDPERDVAVLHLPSERARRAGLRPLTLAPEGAGGSVAFTSGWPGRERHSTAAVRFDDLRLDGQRLRVSANAVRPGDSGGPLLDERGHVLGVVVSGRASTADPDLLDASICVAADPASAIRRYRSAGASLPLARALAEAVDALPSARAHQAAGALAVPSDRNGPSLALLRSALRDAPEDPALLYLAGTVLEEAGEGRLAAGAFQAAHRAGYVPAGYSLAHHLLRAGHHQAAAELFAEAARSGAYRRLGAYGQARALIELGRYDQAETPLEAVLDHDPRFGPALYLLGLVRLSQGRVPEARSLAVRLVANARWAGALDLPLRSEALRPPSLEPLPRVALR